MCELYLNIVLNARHIMKNSNVLVSRCEQILAVR